MPIRKACGAQDAVIFTLPHLLMHSGACCDYRAMSVAEESRAAHLLPPRTENAGNSGTAVLYNVNLYLRLHKAFRKEKDRGNLDQ